MSWDDDCWRCDGTGWVHHETTTHKNAEGKMTKNAPSVRPCDQCRPGRSAVWEAGLDRKVNWNKDADAMVVYRAAEAQHRQPVGAPQ